MQVLLVQLQVLLLPVQMPVQVLLLQHGPKRRRQKWQTGLQQQLQQMLLALNQTMMSSTTSGEHQLRVELETDEGEGEGKSSQKAIRLQQNEVQHPAPRLIATGATGKLKVQLEDPMDRSAKKLKPEQMSKEEKVVSIATGPCVLFPASGYYQVLTFAVELVVASFMPRSPSIIPQAVQQLAYIAGPLLSLPHA